VFSLHQHLRPDPGVIYSDKLDERGILPWLALGCVLLVLLIGGLETAHTHAGSPSNPCSLCITVHATAPAPTLHSLPVFHTIAAIAIPYGTEGKSTSLELTLFIRPPPASV